MNIEELNRSLSREKSPHILFGRCKEKEEDSPLRKRRETYAAAPLFFAGKILRQAVGKQVSEIVDEISKCLRVGEPVAA